MKAKTYSELVKLKSFEERLRYLQTKSKIGYQTFSGHRKLNQDFYQSYEWKQIRRQIILRDNGCDLAHSDFPIFGRIYIHHLNPITIEDFLSRNSNVMDEENLICVSFRTHNLIHFSSNEFQMDRFIKRTKGDTCIWR